MLTDAQVELLVALEAYVEAPTTRRLADKLETPAAGREYWGYDRTHSMLKRLSKRGLVEHDSRRPMHWSVTQAGRDAIAEHYRAEDAAAGM